MKVLIVDDEPHIVNLIRMNLKLEGYDTVCADTGAGAVEAYGNEHPDIVLLDIMLPDMDGYDVLRKIQEIDHSAAVIFITASDKRINKILGLELGADDYITKPFDNKELVLRVRSLWRRISLTRGENGADGAADGKKTKKVEEEKKQYGILTLDAASRSVWVEQRQVTLTYREFDLLCYLVNNRRRVLGREDCWRISGATAIWQQPLGGSAHSASAPKAGAGGRVYQNIVWCGLPF